MTQRHHFSRPREARGLLPLVLAALGAGRAIVGGIQANQEKQRRKGFIEANYRLAKEKLNTNQSLVRQSTQESLAARGLIAGAMKGGTLGNQVTTDTEHQLELERQDLENNKTQALSDNRAAYASALSSSIGAGINTAVSAYGASQDMAAARGASPVKAAMRVSGGPGEMPPAFGGVDPVDPLGHPSSSWYSGGKTLNGAGLSNADFNTGNG